VDQLYVLLGCQGTESVERRAGSIYSVADHETYAAELTVPEFSVTVEGALGKNLGILAADACPGERLPDGAEAKLALGARNEDRVPDPIDVLGFGVHGS
jgi:hypothetical protein